jgi:hypothetical protein
MIGIHGSMVAQGDLGTEGRILANASVKTFNKEKSMESISYPRTRKNLLKRHDSDKMTWRKISEEKGVNVSYIFNYARHGLEPKNPEIRKKLGLPAKCPKCMRPIRTSTPTTRKPRTNWKKIADDLYTELKSRRGQEFQPYSLAIYEYEQAKEKPNDKHILDQTLAAGAGRCEDGKLI